MNKKLFIPSFSILMLFIAFVGCGTEDTPLSIDSANAEDIAFNAAPSNVSTTPLTDLEKDGITFMIEEEKLARDVYITLGTKWSLRNFSNIAKSEQTHMNAIKTLIVRYGLNDPTSGKKTGEFVNADLQELYNKLIVQGNISAIEALKVGATIEEVDIIDLEKHIPETDKSDIKFVYGNLLKGSKNHLVSFVSVLKKYGVTYTPQYLSIEEYNKIIQK